MGPATIAAYPGHQQHGTRPAATAWNARDVRADHEYQRHGTLSLLVGIDLLMGRIHARVEGRHRSREFVAFLRQLCLSLDTAIRLILDNHSAHISKETKAWVAAQPEGRFTFVFTPKHGSWLNLIEGLFSKMARSMLRRIRVASKDELKRRILAYLNDLNRDPVVHSWTYRSARRHDRSRSMETLVLGGNNRPTLPMPYVIPTRGRAAL